LAVASRGGSDAPAVRPPRRRRASETPPRHHQHRRPGVPGRAGLDLGGATGGRRGAAGEGAALAASGPGVAGEERLPRLRGFEPVGAGGVGCAAQGCRGRGHGLCGAEPFGSEYRPVRHPPGALPRLAPSLMPGMNLGAPAGTGLGEAEALWEVETMKILVTGATGQLGSLVLENLLQSVPPEHLAVSVRDPRKAEPLRRRGVDVRQGDFDRPETLEEAFAGAQRILLISTVGDEETRTRQHLAAVAAAQRAGVQFIAYTSLAKADQSPLSLARTHRATEEAIRQSGIPYCFL